MHKPMTDLGSSSFYLMSQIRVGEVTRVFREFVVTTLDRRPPYLASIVLLFQLSGRIISWGVAWLRKQEPARITVLLSLTASLYLVS
ncbi:hypothetical protein LINGRAHAP2_LOCUS21411, partial [Linum grandiflorum]